LFRIFFHSRGGPWSAAGYENPRVDEPIDTIGKTMVTFARDAMIEEVWKIVLDDIVDLPLHHQVIVWAMRENLDVPVDPFYAPNFREARWGLARTLPTCDASHALSPRPCPRS
jgi:ABC-type transport system substrate-binding protein